MMMLNKFNQLSDMSQDVHFSSALMGDVEKSRMRARSLHLTTFNAGCLVPIYCREILPNSSIRMNIEEVVRQTTLLTPTMGNMTLDVYAFFVPNRVVNKSWKAVQGENYSGSWVAPDVTLAPLVLATASRPGYDVPVGSVADYYGFPTQTSIPRDTLAQCHDLKFRGYVMIWNEYFRDQNYQPPIPISYLNIYQDFFNTSLGSDFPIGLSSAITSSTLGDGNFGPGAVAYEVYGSGHTSTTFSVGGVSKTGRFSALSSPLKVNKFHDYFTSVLPSPQKSLTDVLVPTGGILSNSLPVTTMNVTQTFTSRPGLTFKDSTGGSLRATEVVGVASGTGTLGAYSMSATGSSLPLVPSNLFVASGSSVEGLSYDINDLRMAAAVQQYYETLARGGSRYRELVNSFFGISVPDPYSDIPQLLGHVRRDLDLYQTAQTAPSETGSTPQGNLAAFGYTSGSDFLFEHTFVEHGYLHIFAVVRHRNIYSSYLARDNFRLSALDFYTPPLSNIGNQPVYTREINPFVVPGPENPLPVFGYQEAWAEYRFEPDYVTGLMRPGVDGSLALWDYADDFNDELFIADGAWLQSNSQDVLDRTLAVTSAVAPQFKAAFKFDVDKTLPMPTYSVPGLDII